jgi:DNA-binding NarL/FixJ family response regulator
MLKVIIVDDHKVVRKGLRSLLVNTAGNLNIVAEAASAAELFLILQDTTTDVVLMDISLPGMDGLAATAYLQEHYPAIKVIILSMMDNEQYVAKAIAAGAKGYLTKTATQVELVQAIQIVGAGNKYITPEICVRQLGKVQSDLTLSGKSESLSERELTVLRLIAEGYTNEQIADILFNSKRTIETHRQNILVKTKSKNTAHLIVYAARHHLLD